jgi:alkanesulfonate monooxygenase
MNSSPELQVLSSCPDLTNGAHDARFEKALDAARWAERAGHNAFLIPSDNGLADPWVTAQLVLHETDHIRPVVTVEPSHIHPYATAKKIATLARLYGRAPHLNLAAGAYRSDLLSLGDRTPHRDRYARLVEFGTVVQLLLRSEDPVVFDGDFYRLHKPAALPPLGSTQQPDFYVCAGSSAGDEAAARLGATQVHQITTCGAGAARCIRIGIIARQTEAAAWDVAHARFPANPAERFARRLETAWSDSRSHAELLAAAEDDEEHAQLWLAPFENRQAPCAYLVGSHADLSRQVRTWMDEGTYTFLLDAPSSEIDLDHAAVVFARAWKRFRSPLAVSA